MHRGVDGRTGKGGEGLESQWVLWLAGHPQGVAPSPGASGKEDWKFQVWKRKGMSSYEPGQHEAERGRILEGQALVFPLLKDPSCQKHVFLFFFFLLVSCIAQN